MAKKKVTRKSKAGPGIPPSVAADIELALEYLGKAADALRTDNKLHEELGQCHNELHEDLEHCYDELDSIWMSYDLPVFRVGKRNKSKAK